MPAHFPGGEWAHSRGVRAIGDGEDNRIIGAFDADGFPKKEDEEVGPLGVQIIRERFLSRTFTGAPRFFRQSSVLLWLLTPSFGTRGAFGHGRIAFLHGSLKPRQEVVGGS